MRTGCRGLSFFRVPGLDMPERSGWHQRERSDRTDPRYPVQLAEVSGYGFAVGSWLGQGPPSRQTPAPQGQSPESRKRPRGEGGGATRADARRGGPQGRRSPERSKAERRGPRAPGPHRPNGRTAEEGRAPKILSRAPPACVLALSLLGLELTRYNWA